MYGMYKCALGMTRTRYLYPLFTPNFRLPRIVRFSTSIRTSSTTQLEPTNQHYSVDPEVKQVVDLTFASEAVGIPAADGYGWTQFEFGDQIDQDDGHIIARKPGWGCTQALGSLAIACQCIANCRTIRERRRTDTP